MVEEARSEPDGPQQLSEPLALERDRELLTRFREGERAALAAVYRQYVEDVLRLVRFGFVVPGSPPARVPGVELEAQLDVVQEVFARAFAPAARLSYDGLRPYRPWLLRIARNLRIDQCRKDGRELLLLDDRDGGGVGDIDSLIEANRPLPTPAAAEEDLDWDRRAEATRAFVATLDERTRRFVALRFEQGLRQLEVARRMGLSRQQARTLELRVQRDLERHLKKSGVL